jgi:hypothetical protein
VLISIQSLSKLFHFLTLIWSDKLSSPPQIVDDRELDQSRKDERGARPHPNVDRLKKKFVI